MGDASPRCDQVRIRPESASEGAGSEDAMKTCTCRRALLLVPFVVLLMVLPASAGLIVQLSSVTPDPSFPGDFRWSYSVTIPASGDGCLSSECFFTIYDFRGIVTIEAPNDFQASGSLLGITPSGVTPTDDPTIGNVTFSHCAACGHIGPTTLHNFDIISTLGTIGLGQAAWQDSDGYPGDPPRSVQSGLGEVGVPVPVTTPVPEPSSLILLASGVAALAGVACRARRKA